MNGSIFLLGENDELVEMRESTYDSEELLQTLLEDHSPLLAGDQIGDGEPKRWLLVKREAGVPDKEGGLDRWSLDHLFLDQNGVPTLVEVKRSSDTRTRREVVGQMLDYAANAVAYWSIDKVVAEFESTCSNRNLDSTAVLAEHLDEEVDAEAFWQQVQTNLQAGKVRMVFVADQVPQELQRIVEFLNGQMNPAEVLALEVRQFSGSGLRTLVPRVLGQTAAALQKKAVRQRSTVRWDEASFIARLEEQGFAEEALVVRRVLEWADQDAVTVGWGGGERHGSFKLQHRTNGTNYQLCYLWAHNAVGLPFHWLRERQPFVSQEKRLELLNRLNRIPGIDIPLDKIDSSPGFEITVLTDEPVLRAFLEELTWMVREADAYHEEGTPQPSGRQQIG